MAGSGLDFEKQFEELERLIAELKKPEKRAEAAAQGIDLDAQVAQLEAELQRMLRKQYSALTPWEKTLVARHKDRPYSLDYIRMIFDDFLELYGDRLAGNDEAVVGGLAVLNGDPVVVIGQQKGRDLKERQRRNFGSARPEGFRKALRLARLAEKFRKPLISLVDTPAAAADLGSEERGISEAIARNLKEFSMLKTPVVVAIIGEGGSGGALGMAVGDRVLMLEHSVYSVIPPEGCAAILWRDRERAPDAAKALNLTAQGALALGIIDEVLPEPVGGAHRDPPGAASTLKEALVRHLGALRQLNQDELVSARMERLRSIGFWLEA
ncbi:MAG: acetyl-CoA carboxylase carboxyltransferase subunit alpha [Chthonomonadales bacterium]